MRYEPLRWARCCPTSSLILPTPSSADRIPCLHRPGTPTWGVQDLPKAARLEEADLRPSQGPHSYFCPTPFLCSISPSWLYWWQAQRKREFGRPEAPRLYEALWFCVYIYSEKTSNTYKIEQWNPMYPSSSSTIISLCPILIHYFPCLHPRYPQKKQHTVHVSMCISKR